jgi:hypothetical protein
MSLVFLAKSHHSTQFCGRHIDSEDRHVGPVSAAAAEKAEHKTILPQERQAVAGLPRAIPQRAAQL